MCLTARGQNNLYCYFREAKCCLPAIFNPEVSAQAIKCLCKLNIRIENYLHKVSAVVYQRNAQTYMKQMEMKTTVDNLICSCVGQCVSVFSFNVSALIS